MRHQLEGVLRRGWPVLAGLALGLIAGGIWTFLQPERHRAEASVLLRGPAASGAVPAVRAVGESSILGRNVAQTLRLAKPPTVTAEAEEGRIVRLAVEARTPEGARQIDAEAAQVLIQLVDARFGAARLEATVLDPAHPVKQTSPTPDRNFLVTGLIGLVFGAAGALAFGRRRYAPAAPGTVDPRLERRLQKRIEQVTERELRLARRAGELAVREARLVEREGELTSRAAQPEQPVLEAVVEPESGAVPPPAPQPQPPLTPTVGQEASSTSARWTVAELEKFVGERRSESPDRVEEWETYLFLLRGHARIDGSLPISFDGLILDVFGDEANRRSGFSAD